MKRSTEIEFAIAEILASENLLLVNDLLPERGNIRNDSGNVLIRGRAEGKHHITSSQSVIVDTSIDGEVGTPCRIEAEGDVVITGSAINLHITARSIHIGGDARDCRLESLRKITVEGNIFETHSTLGHLGSCRRQIKTKESRLRQMIEQKDILNRNIERDSNRLLKACQAPRFNLNLGVGRLIQHDSKGLRIDLAFFYQQLNQKNEDDIQAALVEFFNRGIVGMLGRTNRPYFIDSPASERVFIKTLANLRKLVLLVRQHDVHSKCVEKELNQANSLINHFEDPRRHLRAQGRLSAGSSVHFIQPTIQVSPQGHIDITNRQLTLNIHSTNDGPELEHLCADQHSERMPTTPETLSNTYVGLDEAATPPAIRILPFELPQQSAPVPPKPSLLVVSDSPFVADFVADELLNKGYDQVRVVENGYEAIDLLREQAVDIAIFDLNTPGVDGEAFLQAVRQTKGGHSAGTILVARPNEEEKAIEALDHGADEYLLKPLAIEAIQQRIDQLINRPQNGDHPAPYATTDNI